jgi:hypothetical protein
MNILTFSILKTDIMEDLNEINELLNTEQN